MLLVPLAYLIFIIRLVAISIGQQTLWIAFIILSTLIAVISLAINREEQPQDIPKDKKYPTRLQTWIKTLDQKEQSEYFKWNLAQNLSNLFVEALAYHQGASRDQVLQKLKNGMLDLPPDVLAYLQVSQTPFSQTGLVSYNPGNWYVRIWDSIFKRQTLKTTKSPLDLEPEKIIHYLENYLGFDS